MNFEKIRVDLFDFMKIKVLYAIVKYNIPEILNNGPLSIMDIAEKTKTNKNNLKKMLKYLVKIGYFEEIKDDIYKNNELSEKLIDYKDVIIYHATMLYNAFVNFEDLLNPNEKLSPFQIYHGDNFWSWLNKEENNNLLKAFSNFMTAVTVTSGYDWSQYVGKKIVDIGGNKGQYFTDIIKKNPGMKADIFDLPEVGRIIINDNNNTIKFIGGDMFEYIPENYDIYFLRYILHDWSDEKCNIILKNIYNVIPSNGRLLISEQIMAPHVDAITYEYSLQMMCLFDGKERTEKEFNNLLMNNGFKIINITKTDGINSIISAIPIK